MPFLDVCSWPLLGEGSLCESQPVLATKVLRHDLQAPKTLGSKELLL